MSKAIYLSDPDGIGVEITLETPERFHAYSVAPGLLQVIDADGRIRRGAEPLNVEVALATLPDHDIKRPVPSDAKIGHVRLHVGNLEQAYEFYHRLGFTQNVIFPQLGFADLGVCGSFNHRIGINTWQGAEAPQAPYGTARMRHFTLRFQSGEQLTAALMRLPHAEKVAAGYTVQDPAGNRLVLTQHAVGNSVQSMGWPRHT